MFDVATPRAQGVPPESTLGLAAQLEQQRQAEMEQTKRTVAQLREQGLPSERGITDTVKFAMGSALRGASRIMEERQARAREQEVLEMALQQQKVENENTEAEAKALQQIIENQQREYRESRSQPHLSIPHQAAVRAQAIAQASRPLLNPGGVYAGVLGSGAASSSSAPVPPPPQSQGHVPITVPDDRSQGAVPPKTSSSQGPPKTPVKASGSAPAKTPSTVEYSPSTGKARPPKPVPTPTPKPGSAEANRRALADMVRTERRMLRSDALDDIEQERAIAAAQERARARPVPPMPSGGARQDLNRPAGRHRNPKPKPTSG